LADCAMRLLLSQQLTSHSRQVGWSVTCWGCVTKFEHSLQASRLACVSTVAVALQVKNVALYVSEMQRSLSDKIAKNFFNDPSQARMRPPLPQAALPTLLSCFQCTHQQVEKRGLHRHRFCCVYVAIFRTPCYGACNGRNITGHHICIMPMSVAQASIACVVTAPPEIADKGRITGKDGKELISQNRNISLFQQKALRVRRLYDEQRDTVIYVAYSTRLTSASDEGGASQGRYKCAALCNF
jgi:catabolite regulation protein CreA